MPILYHAIDGAGLGHLMRLSTIADTVQLLRPSTAQLIVTNAPQPAFRGGSQIPLISIPDHDQGPFRGLNRRMTRLPFRMVEAMLLSLVGDYAPDCIVLDTHFSPDLVRRASRESRHLVLVLRRTKPRHIERLVKSDLLELFDLVLIPHELDVYVDDLAPWLVSKITTLPNVQFVGPIVRPSGGHESTSTRHRPAGEGAAALVVVTCGVGGYRGFSAHTMSRVLTALRLLSRPTQLVVVGGAKGVQTELPPGSTWRASESELPSLLAAADLVVGTAGYNTVHEVAQAGTPAVFIAAPRRNEDQSVNARWLVRSGLASCLDVTSSPRDIAEAMTQQLGRARYPGLAFEGRWRAAASLVRLVPRAQQLILGEVLDPPLGWTNVTVADLNGILARTMPASSDAVNRTCVLVNDTRFTEITADERHLAADWYVDVGRSPVRELVERVARLRDSPLAPVTTVVATVARDPGELIAACRAFRGIVLRAQCGSRGELPEWIEVAYEYARDVPGLFVDVTDAANPLLSTEPWG